MGLLTFMAGFVAYFLVRYRAEISRTIKEFEEFKKSKGTIALPGESFDDDSDLEFNLDLWNGDKKEAS